MGAIKDLGQMEANEKPTYLYHYTTAEGLKGLVEKQELWATDILYLNDWTEFYHGRAEFKRELEKRVVSMPKDTPDGKVAQIVSDLLDESNALGSNRVFVCSFSEKGNDLSQWRAYCQDGGYSIGFRRDQLAQLADRENNCNLRKCEYFGDCAHHVDRLLRFLSKKVGCESTDTSVSATELLLCKFAAEYKDSSFLGEKEWRLISARSEPKLQFRARGAFLVPYITFKLDDADLWKDVRIRVGPCSRESDELRVQSVKMFLQSELKKHRLPATCRKQVKASGIPYRTGMGG
jgi:hypothetical protein